MASGSPPGGGLTPEKYGFMKQDFSVDILADLVCPWCYLGFRQLVQARAMVTEVEVAMHLRPYLLDAGMPRAGRPYRLYRQQKLGGRDQADAMERELTQLGKDANIEFDFEAIETASSSIDAHRLVHWAGQAEKGVQEHVAGALFSRYFEQGQDIGRHDILVDTAAEAGMRADVIARLLTTPIDVQTIRDDADSARHMHVDSVPCFILDKKYAVMGAQSAEALADAIRQTADGFEPIRR